MKSDLRQGGSGINDEAGGDTDDWSGSGRAGAGGRAVREQFCDELVAAFAEHDTNRSGFLDPITLGHVLAQRNLQLPQAKLRQIMNNVEKNEGELDYRAFAWELGAVNDPNERRKVSEGVRE